jgi:hypothetical protein
MTFIVTTVIIPSVKTLNIARMVWMRKRNMKNKIKKGANYEKGKTH